MTRPVGFAATLGDGDSIRVRLATRDQALVNELRAVPGVDYEPKLQLWTIPPTEAERAGQIALSYDLQLIGPVPVPKLPGPDDRIVVPGGELRPYQQIGARFIYENERIWLADVMGTGKTLQCLAAAYHWKLWPMIVVVPESLLENWRHEARRWLGVSARIIRGRKVRERLLKNQICLIGYSILPWWDDAIKEAGFEMIVFDESHYVKNKSAKRSKAALVAASGSKYRVLASGTPILNQPTEAIHQLRTMGRLDDQAVGGGEFFLKRYCGGVKTNVKKRINGKLVTLPKWSFGEPSRLTELNRRMRAAGIYLRREKRDVLPELPAKMTAAHILNVGDLAEYQAAKKSLDDAKASTTLTSSEKAAATNASVSSMRRILGLQKIAPGIEWIEDLLEQTGERALVFFHHRAVGEALAEHFKCPLIYGGMSGQARDQIVQSFQAGKHRVIALSLSVGSLGLTLTAATEVVFLEFGWTPAEMEQASDRAHRLGQEKTVTAWWLAAADTVEELMVDKLTTKQVTTSAFNSGAVGYGVVAGLLSEGMSHAE